MKKIMEQGNKVIFRNIKGEEFKVDIRGKIN
jgi:hypothetical protein